MLHRTPLPVMSPPLHILLTLLAITVGTTRAWPQQPAGDDPVTGTWRFWNNTLREMRPDGSSGAPGKPADATWKCLSAPGMIERVYMINYGGSTVFDKLTLRSQGQQLWGTAKNKPFLTAVRDSKTIAPIASAKGKGAPAATAGGKLYPDYGGMVLSADWQQLSKSGSPRKELMLSSEFYAHLVVANAQKRKKTTPDKLYGDIHWLMSLDDAQKVLPKQMSKGTITPLTHLCFPSRSLSIKEFEGSFEDRGQVFRHLYLMLDSKQQVVGVQLEDLTADNVLWENGRPDGLREPYYNFLNLTNNASKSNQVHYQVLDSGPGVSLVKFALWNIAPLRRYKENIHWYLPAPVAQSMLEIVERQRQSSGLK